MTPLSDALTAAQRSALAALEKAYVAEQVDEREMRASLAALGISDPVDIGFLLAALDVLREWGVSAPTMTERVTEAKDEPASQKQLDYIESLMQGRDPEHIPDGPLTKAQASEVIDTIQKGTYDPAKWRVPF